MGYAPMHVEENVKDVMRRHHNDPKVSEDHVAFDARLDALGPCTGCADRKDS